jgi:glycosyltransferase involved in cell wall biosynthesis
MSPQKSPVVSVIVPARNEEACLGPCLESLVTQAGIDFEIIVVDDGSTDRTAEIAKSFSEPRTLNRFRAHNDVSTPASDVAAALVVIPAPPLPNKWTGKNNAMSSGAKIASGKWLLFTDADTVHKPGSLARAVAEAEERGFALLSYSPEQEVRTFSERTVLPVIFAELAATYPPKKVSDPASPVAAANGQYLLIAREAYDAVGGHTKISSHLLEDVALARLVKSSGRRIFFRYGGDAVRTRMYRSWAQMKEGWTKNLALLFKHPVRRALMLLAFWVLAWSTFVLGLAAIVSGYWKIAYYLLPWFWLYGRIASARFRASTNLLAVGFGIPLVAYLFAESIIERRNGAVMWKGRSYQSDIA